jgi:hypothetical protein
MSDLFRADRHAEIQRILGEQKTLLDDMLETQRDIGRQLGCAGADSGGLASQLGSLGHTMDRGFAELNRRIEHTIQLLQRVIDKD